MNTLFKGLSVGLCMSASVLAFATSAHALTINDTVGAAGDAPYIGGDPTLGAYYGKDVIGEYDIFAIHSTEVFRTGAGLNSLGVKVYTNYAGQGGAVNTQYGALFIGTQSGPGGFVPNAVDPTNNDTFTGNTTRFQYALDMDYASTADDDSGNSTLWALAGDGTDVQLTQGSGFRENQAWRPYTTDPDGAATDPDPDGDGNPLQAATDSGLDGTWKFEKGTNSASLNNPTNTSSVSGANDNQNLLTQGTGFIEFVITDFFANGNPGNPGAADDPVDYLVFAWAMSCANDIALAEITDPFENIPGVPLPGGLILLLSGLLGIGWLGRSRVKLAD